MFNRIRSFPFTEEQGGFVSIKLKSIFVIVGFLGTVKVLDGGVVMITTDPLIGNAKIKTPYIWVFFYRIDSVKKTIYSYTVYHSYFFIFWYLSSHCLYLFLEFY